MLSKLNINKLLMSFLTLVLLAAPQLSYADWGFGIRVGDHDRDHHYYRYHDHPRYGIHSHYLPAGYLTLWVGGNRYFYADGLYYSYVGGDYIIVNPPIGAYVNVIPPDFHAVRINGRIYYTDNGVYYVLTQHHGYKVVIGPSVYAQHSPVIIAQPVTVNAQDSFPINIPNNNGSYNTVIIKKTGNGFIGPQGEFYAQFPSVSQLRMMYGR